MAATPPGTDRGPGPTSRPLDLTGAPAFLESPVLPDPGLRWGTW